MKPFLIFLLVTALAGCQQRQDTTPPPPAGQAGPDLAAKAAAAPAKAAAADSLPRLALTANALQLVSQPGGS